MIPIDVARLEFSLHANALERALGRGGAAVDLARASWELDAVQAALVTLTTALMATKVDACPAS